MRKRLGDEIFLDRVSVDAVIDLGEQPAHIPFPFFAGRFSLFKPLKLKDQVKLELWADPRGKFEGNVLVRKCAAAIPAGLGIDADCTRRIDPSLGRQRKTIRTRFIFKPLEFEGFKKGVVEDFPESHELDRATRAHPVLENMVYAIRIPKPCDVGE